MKHALPRPNDLPDFLDFWPVPFYHRDPDGFFNALADLAGILAAEGL
jgi:hypothetical protein